MLKSSFKYLMILPLYAAIAMSSCKDETPTLEVPASYSFDPMSYSGQIQRLNMLTELSAYVKSGAEGNILDADVMQNMYANSDNPFADAVLNGSGKDLESKTFDLDINYIKNQFDIAEAASITGIAASNGQAGILSNGTKSYLVDANGMEPAQLIEKVLMGACFYYQITSVYLGAERQSADNSISDPVNGTDLEHHWDEAFGYTAFAQDFGPAYPSAGLRFWAKYSNDRDALLNCNIRLMDAFKTGRAAISTGMLDIRDAQIPIILEVLEEVIAGTAIHYLNGAVDNFADDALRNHELSEALAFIKALTYNPERTITISEIDAISEMIGDNLYEVNVSKLQDARAALAEIYAMQAIETQL